MTHLILCREFPPAPYPAGGIGTYAHHIAHQLAQAGETVHILTQQWEGAPDRIASSHDGRLIIHRIPLEASIHPAEPLHPADTLLIKQLSASTCPSQLFSWQAARYAEALIEREPIDLIEAQEWEAPLYYLQVRRALGLGPRRQPPTLVHLHSPSHMIFRHNQWDETLTDFLPLTRFEQYSIRAADALLCPSRYLAQGVAQWLNLEPSRIEVIPYAMGDETPILPRSPLVWARNSICYVGRLELRKGVVEWVDAAVSVAATDPSVSFDFFGGDTYLGGGAGPSVLDHLRSRIPRTLLPRFHFHGSRSRPELLAALAQTSVAVVPSRWENFPFTCIEAMSTGLPVLASPNGGMAEMLVDGESGWLSPDQSAPSLAATLRRVLATSPQARAAMGAAAAQSIRQLCANETIVARHIALRRRIADSGPIRSLRPAAPSTVAPVPDPSRHGMGLVLTFLDHPRHIDACLESLGEQTDLPFTLILVADRLRKRLDTALQDASAAITARITVHQTADLSPEAARRLGTESLLAVHPSLRSIACIDQSTRLEPAFVTTCESVFAAQPQVGLVRPWLLRLGRNGGLDPGPTPITVPADLPYSSALRTDLLSGNPEAWSSVTYPAPLVSRLPPHPRVRRRYSGMALIQSPSPQFALRWFLGAPLPEKIRWLSRIAANPTRLLRWLTFRLRALFPKSIHSPPK